MRERAGLQYGVKEELEKLKELLKKARRVSVLTGAGISAESGVPTFRGEEGLWKQHRATDLATPQAFAKDPALVWEFYNWRRRLLAQVTYNRGHSALVILEDHVPKFTLITQNVDGLHSMAGSRNVLEIHGNIWEVLCTACRRVLLDRSPDMGPLPKCEYCGELLRPNVIWFGESLVSDLLDKALEASRSSDVMLSVGTSAAVEPAASLAIEAKSSGAVLAEVNLETTPHSALADFTLLGKAGDILPRLVEAWA
jgi:NAD-dependent deacetylase